MLKPIDLPELLASLREAQARTETTRIQTKPPASGRHAVQGAEVIQDRDTRRSKGFGFVQMGSEPGPEGAIAALKGQQQGRPRPQR